MTDSGRDPVTEMAYTPLLNWSAWGDAAAGQENNVRNEDRDCVPYIDATGDGLQLDLRKNTERRARRACLCRQPLYRIEACSASPKSHLRHCLRQNPPKEEEKEDEGGKHTLIRCQLATHELSGCIMAITL